MLLLIIFILGYGTASQALLNPVREFHIEDLPDMIKNIVYLPYWQMYGELSLDSIENHDKIVCYEDNFCEDFTFYNHVAMFFLAIYMLVGNVMLLNLLIAIFTSVFENVRENSKEVWKFEMYRLVEEYDRKPMLPVPFTIFEETFRLCKKLWQTTCKRSKENVDLSLARTIETLDLLENDSLNTYLNKKSEEESAQIDKKMSIMEEKIMKVLEYIEENDKDNETANDWGDEFPAGVSPYSSNPDDSLTLCLNRSNSTIEAKLVDEEMDRTTLEKEKLDNERQISARLEKIEETISCIEKESSKTLLKMEEIFLLIKEIKHNK